jgi:hypothetical protein
MHHFAAQEALISNGKRIPRYSQLGAPSNDGKLPSWMADRACSTPSFLRIIAP